jgi:hypothetical protein
MARNAFGLQTEDDDLQERIAASLEDAPDDAPDDAPVEVATEDSGDGVGTPEPVQAPSPELPEEPEPALDEAEPEPEPEPLVEAEEATPYAGRYSTSYQTLEAFEEAHRNALDMHRQATERAKQAEMVAQQQAEYLRIAAEYIQNQQNEAAKPKEKTPTELAAEAERYGLDEETYKATLEVAQKMVDERLGPMQQTWEQQQAAQEEERRRAAIGSEVQRFKTAHAEELTPEIETGMVAFFNEQNLDPSDGNWYEIALEAVQNPQLYEVLAANPNYLDNEAGWNYARRMAGVTHATAPASRAAELAVARKRAQVEGGNPGAPTQMEKREDPSKDPNSWEAVMALREGAPNSKKSAFGV